MTATLRSHRLPSASRGLLDSLPSDSRKAVHPALGRYSRKGHLLRLCQSTPRHVSRNVFQRTEEIAAILVVRTWSLQQIVCVRVHGDHDEAARIGPNDRRAEREQHDRQKSTQADDPPDSNRNLPTADNDEIGQTLLSQEIPKRRPGGELRRHEGKREGDWTFGGRMRAFHGF